MKEKVMIHEGPTTEVHLIRGDFLSAAKTICGERLHPISCTHVVNDAIPVTCKRCKEVRQ